MLETADSVLDSGMLMLQSCCDLKKKKKNTHTHVRMERINEKLLLQCQHFYKYVSQ